VAVVGEWAHHPLPLIQGVSSHLLVLQHGRRHVERPLKRPDLLGHVTVLALVVAAARVKGKGEGEREAIG
jgi:hypothetical protein